MESFGSTDLDRLVYLFFIVTPRGNKMLFVAINMAYKTACKCVENRAATVLAAADRGMVYFGKRMCITCTCSCSLLPADSLFRSSQASYPCKTRLFLFCAAYDHVALSSTIEWSGADMMKAWLWLRYSLIFALQMWVWEAVKLAEKPLLMCMQKNACTSSRGCQMATCTCQLRACLPSRDQSVCAYWWLKVTVRVVLNRDL